MVGEVGFAKLDYRRTNVLVEEALRTATPELLCAVAGVLDVKPIEFSKRFGALHQYCVEPSSAFRPALRRFQVSCMCQLHIGQTYALVDAGGVGTLFQIIGFPHTHPKTGWCINIKYLTQGKGEIEHLPLCGFSVVPYPSGDWHTFHWISWRGTQTMSCACHLEP